MMAQLMVKIVSWFGILCCFQVVASEVRSVYINESRIEYKQVHDSAHTAELNVYLAKNKQPDYKIKINRDYRLYDAAIFAHKLVLLLRIQNTYHVLITQKNTGQILGSFWSAFASISPSGRFLVYTRWAINTQTPPYGWDGGVTLVYDVTKSPEDNRIARIVNAEYDPRNRS